jgi:hypothetical protein
MNALATRGASGMLAVCVIVAVAQDGLAQRNCPIVTDQLIAVPRDTPISFRLDVEEAESSVVTVFTFPLGGILRQTGPTQLDYAFIPFLDFNGTTNFKYRVTPPTGCPDSVVLGCVTLASGNAGSIEEQTDTTAEGLVLPPDTSLGDVLALALSGNLCGVGFALPAAGAVAMLTTLAHRRRRRR